MTFARSAFSCLVLVAILTGCSSRRSAAASSEADNLGAFKTALIAYIDAHPGFFIGRELRGSLKAEPVERCESPESQPKYELGEFLIFPRQMRFEVCYGASGPEPYEYKGEFVTLPDGSLEVGKVVLRRWEQGVRSVP